MHIPNTPDNIGTSGADRDHVLRDLLSQAISRSPKKRLQIAEELTAVLQMRVTANMLNDFTSDSHRGVRFPLLFCAALCEILDDDSIAVFALRPRIRSLIEFAERHLASIREKEEVDLMRDQLLDELVERAKSERRQA